MIVCHCAVVSDRDVRAAVDNGAHTLAKVCQSTGAAQECGCCVFGVRRLLEAYSEFAVLRNRAKETDAPSQPTRRRVA